MGPASSRHNSKAFSDQWSRSGQSEQLFTCSFKSENGRARLLTSRDFVRDHSALTNLKSAFKGRGRCPQRAASGNGRASSLRARRSPRGILNLGDDMTGLSRYTNPSFGKSAAAVSVGNFGFGGAGTNASEKSPPEFGGKVSWRSGCFHLCHRNKIILQTA